VVILLLSIVIFLAVFLILLLKRASGIVLAIGLVTTLLLITVLASFGMILNIIFWAILLLILLPANISSIRKKYFTSKVFAIYKSSKPTMSRTEQEALDSGTVGWEGDLFAGKPDWNKLYTYPVSTLSQVEQEFLDGPVEALCKNIDGWSIENSPVGLPEGVWNYLLNNKFFSMNIPTEYGGLGFGSRAYSEVVTKLGGINGSVSIVSSVPNSLGPAELLLHYGTEEQKNYYLPRLANGEEVPCFALTSALAGSDASGMQDYGVVCEEELNGEKQLCIRLNFAKRYITLAPVATILGLAFKLYDPNHLLGDIEDIGITCALIPVNTKGVSIGRYHLPLRASFPNGPVIGENVLISIEQIIGGRAQAGGGWRMLMECLADGRGVSIPSIVIGACKSIVLATTAYTRVRKQFNSSLMQFEGITKPLAEIVASTFVVESVRRFITSALDAGERPAVAAGIAKLHVSEIGRTVINHAMDINAGKGICRGPGNYLNNAYFGIPVGITVEGANILTRNMIIFGQGAMRCHPYILAEVTATEITDAKESLDKFDQAFSGHLMYYLQNIASSFILGLTNGRFAACSDSNMSRYEQIYSRFSAVLAMLTDTTIISLGSALKRRENISARLGDMLSYLYMGSAALKYSHSNQIADLDVVMTYIHKDLAYKLQVATDEIINNLPIKGRWLLRLICLPFGRGIKPPSDNLAMEIAEIISKPSALRDALAENLYMEPNDNNPGAKLGAALDTLIKFDPIERKIIKAVKNKEIAGYSFAAWIEAALENAIITQDEYDFAKHAYALRMDLIAVNDFSMEEIIAKCGSVTK
jgi:acyl-CoA dehydrogenase